MQPEEEADEHGIVNEQLAHLELGEDVHNLQHISSLYLVHYDSQMFSMIMDGKILSDIFRCRFGHSTWRLPPPSIASQPIRAVHGQLMRQTESNLLTNRSPAITHR